MVVYCMREYTPISNSTPWFNSTLLFLYKPSPSPHSGDSPFSLNNTHAKDV